MHYDGWPSTDQILHRASRTTALMRIGVRAATPPRAATTLGPAAARAAGAPRRVALLFLFSWGVDPGRLQEDVEPAGLAEDLEEARIIEVMRAQVMKHGAALVEERLDVE